MVFTDCQYTNLKIIDFGLAKPLSLDGTNLNDLGESSGCGRSDSRMCPGTFTHWSPEVARYEFRFYNHISRDIWACGIVLYQMATLVLPFDFDKNMQNRFAVIYAIGANK